MASAGQPCDHDHGTGRDLPSWGFTFYDYPDFNLCELLKHMSGLMQPDRGRVVVVVDGKDLCCLRRSALARALVRSPEIMLFDEPTTGLDPFIVHSIRDLIQSSHERLQFTCVIVTQEAPCIFQIVQKVALLNNGVIEVVGSPDEVMTSKDPAVRDFIDGCILPGRPEMLDMELRLFEERTGRKP